MSYPKKCRIVRRRPPRPTARMHQANRLILKFSRKTSLLRHGYSLSSSESALHFFEASPGFHTFCPVVPHYPSRFNMHETIERADLILSIGHDPRVPNRFISRGPKSSVILHAF
ncbi:hypothetical protein [Gluconacetobacter sacchari]|uniref:Uncharacterized protein n=1 Tax=Gluconacetobacter sacchari TaxID=92759 RepID=A0A7W4IDW9_9PROT|nr:hypothetical protein [Gluconacetobacter sacchari]MBB2161058.1 hypothetical protein [Gluconacetobacter sacchari]